MKLVIEIDEARFKDIQRIASVQLKSNYFQTAEQIIASGSVVLDKIKVEVEEEDCISRRAVLDMMQIKMSDKELYMAVYELPSVNPQPQESNQQLCDDVISRQAAKKALEDRFMELQKRHDDKRYETNYCLNTILELPPVNPQPKTGHWIIIDKELQRYKCSECGEVIRLYKKSEIPKLEKDETLSNYPFSHCGCRMIESQESEE